VRELFANPKHPYTRALLETVPSVSGNRADRLRAEVAAAGFPYEGALGAASLNFGTLSALTGLDGDSRVARIDMAVEEAEAGAPLLDMNGSVVGMLIPAPQTGRTLPPGTAFALRGDAMAAALAEAGVGVNASAVADNTLTRNALARNGMDLAVLVTCWN